MSGKVGSGKKNQSHKAWIHEHVNDAWVHGVTPYTTTGVFGKSSNVGTLMLGKIAAASIRTIMARVPCMMLACKASGIVGLVRVCEPTPAQILELKICDIAVGSAAFLVETCRQLGDALVKAWRHHGGRPPLPDDETEELLAMRTVAQGQAGYRPVGVR